VLNVEPPFTFNNTIHSERKADRKEIGEKNIEHKIKRMMLEKKLD